MHASVRAREPALHDLCRRFGVRRSDVFGSAARSHDFDPDRSDVDLLVDFTDDTNVLGRFLDLHDALEQFLARPVDLIDRRDIELSRNYIRRRQILENAETIYAV